MVKIGIIVPVYNVEKYIRQCIESILSQNYKDFSLVLVDDGSPDNSGEICDRYAENDERIHVIHQINGGLSAARNSGIKYLLHNGSSEWLIFIDSDDYLDDKNALQKISERLTRTNADILSYSYKKFEDGTENFEPYFKTAQNMPLKFTDKYIQIDYLTNNSLYIASACNKAVKSKIIKEHNILFYDDSAAEDIEWCGKLLYYADSFDYINEDFYCYRQRADSKRYTISPKICDDIHRAIKNLLALVSTTDDKLLKEYIYRYLAFQYSTFFIVQAQSSDAPEAAREKMSEYTFLLNYHAKNKKIEVLNILTKIFGYKNLCKIIRFVYRKTR